jgi:hypothetical protein
MSHGERSGGTVRSKQTIDGRRVDRITATCERCRVAMHEHGRTAPEARLLATKRGWSVTLLRQRTLDGGETRVWRVICPACVQSSNVQTSASKPR